MLDKELMQSAREELKELRQKLLEVRTEADRNHPRYQSLLNLKQYLLLRSKDHTALQEKLFMLSLSSLGRSYAHVAASIDTLYDQLSTSMGKAAIPESEAEKFHHLGIQEAIAAASKNSKALFGGRASSKLSRQSTAVMVTLPSHAPDNNGALIRELAGAGVNVFRINTAHDTPETWKAMADIIAAINADREAGEKLKIFVDLAGPKIRTGTIRRLSLPIAVGSNKREKKLLLLPEGATTRPERTDPVTLEKLPAQIVVRKAFFDDLEPNQRLKIVDVNGKKAAITVTEINGTQARCLIDKKVFINESCTLGRKKEESPVLNLDTQIDPIRLFANDRLVITEKDLLGRSAERDAEGTVTQPALIGCTFRGMIDHIKEGDHVFIDDGKIGLKVVEKNHESVTCKVTHAKASGTVLKEEKGINFPDTYIKTPALTDTDRDNALAVLGFADMLGLSFCQSAKDVGDLQQLLEENGRSDIGIVAKIETKKAVSHMPEILEQLLVSEKSGVMIARGDLAIEAGFQHMAYIQEALLDICDAAHMPVIWATQVLESQMKSNLPSRAEVTDAAMSGRAECVMLNKGTFAVDTIETLTCILDDMHSLFKKNRQLLKKETLW